METNAATQENADEFCHPSNILWTEAPWKGRVTFTGPDGIRDHRVSVEPEHRYVGIGTMSREGTSEVDYLWRPAPGTEFARPKTASVGEVGWCIPSHQDWNYPNTARQIMLGHFRQDLEDRYSHNYQNAWYPGPNDVIQPNSDAALVMNVYRNSNTAQRTRSRGDTTSSHSSRPGDRTQQYLGSRE